MPASIKTWKGAEAVQSVMVLSKTTGAARTVLLVIAAHADSEGRAFPSIKRIARLANITERHTKGILKMLPADEIQIEQRGGRGHSNRYRILLPKANWSSPFADGEKVNFTALKGEFSSTEKVNSVVEKGEPQFTRIDSNQQIEETGRLVGQTTESSNVEVSSCFQEEWLDNLKKQYPDHNLEYELTKFQDHCDSKGTPPNRVGFEGWMKRAFIPIKIKNAPKKDIPPEYDYSW